jgi:dTMP kinase
MKKGKLIVIDGSDGVGKATQTRILVERLKKEKIPVATLDFPQYKNNFFGAFIKECLSGKHGDFIALDPHIASVLYAADRFESKKKIEKWLAQGKIVVLDRYVSANQMHQGGKIKNPNERKKFLMWLDTMEHKIFMLPRPDSILYLHLPTALSLKLINTRGEKDLAEKNIKYLSQSRQNALRLIQTSACWKKVNCANAKGILSREKIHEMVYTAFKRLAGI